MLIKDDLDFKFKEQLNFKIKFKNFHMLQKFKVDFKA